MGLEELVLIRTSQQSYRLYKYNPIKNFSIIFRKNKQIFLNFQTQRPSSNQRIQEQGKALMLLISKSITKNANDTKYEC